YILKSKVHLLTKEVLYGVLKDAILSRKKIVVNYLNIHVANIAFKDQWFRDSLNSCDLVLCDGKGIQLSAFLLGKEVPQQFPYNRWLWDFFSFCEKEQYSLFFLGSKPGIYAKAWSKIKEKGYQFRMNGHHGYFNTSNSENDAVIGEINKFKPDFLIVGLGVPLQDKWVNDNLSKLNVPVIMMGGAYLDWISGAFKMPPKIISSSGFEWLYRLVLEPKRLGERYLIGIPRFFTRILKHSS
ncbi:MAG TPA: WecB/TagA/CpsF family glycosyltransferase, partial [Flavitalea sp.]|nr:WecB/TagA/CpsF family glycosyltransferase [Flavitalea sp.]